MLEKLHSAFKMHSKSLGSPKDDIYELRKSFSISIPSDYLSLIKQATDIEISVRDEVFIRIWGANTCIELNEAYNVQEQIPDSLLIGDDEGGSALFYADGHSGFGLYIGRFADLDLETSKFIAGTLTEFLTKGFGVGTVVDFL